MNMDAAGKKVWGVAPGGGLGQPNLNPLNPLGLRFPGMSVGKNAGEIIDANCAVLQPCYPLQGQVIFNGPHPTAKTVAPTYTDAEKTPPHGKTLQAQDLWGKSRIPEKKLLNEDGGATLWAVGDWKPGAKPVIVVHGIGSDFDDIKAIVERYKDDPTRQVMVLAYDDMGEFTEESGKQLAYQMENFRQKYSWGNEVDIVAHSMGGIVAKRALNELAEGELGGIENYKKIQFVAIDTPWHGFPGPGVRFNIVQGGMDMQALSNMYTGDAEANDAASQKGLAGVQLPKNVQMNLVFADNEAGGLKRDSIKDYTDFAKKLGLKKLEQCARAMLRGDLAAMQRDLSAQNYNFFAMLMQNSTWPQLKDDLDDLVKGNHLSVDNFGTLLQRYMPRFAGEHSEVLSNPKLLQYLDQTLQKK